jgi:hypothetical protein
MDPDPGPGPAIFVLDCQDSNEKLPISFLKFFGLLLFEGTFLTSFSKEKRHKRVTKH